MALTRLSHCKVNLLLNILARRDDGFHELETVMQPVQLHDQLEFERAARGIQLSCNDPSLPTDANNLVHRAAQAFLRATGIRDGVRVHLDKRIPKAAGLGGGSGDAATALLGLNELFANPLDGVKLAELAASLGSDVPFFLQSRPALGTGRGERVEPLEPFAAFRGVFILLVHPGFGISTPWAYKQLARFPEATHGRAGRAQHLIALLDSGDLAAAGAALFNSLEMPALHKFPVLAMYQESFKAHGAAAALMSGSGSTTFGLVRSRAAGEELLSKFRSRFGATCWAALVPLDGRES
ncbi:MAG: 4-(cytidine 5'-diphospho)-2-C-methyl-D-erythritol kinase [Verrucomicrobia bacterium]|nr:4-(cytidine 5'-diphospho)-2-C-methyl-D-erythritol kinase [Verrucomicrobiota bacterium]